MKLTGDVHLIAGGDYGFNLTHRLDCHVYAINCGDEIVLIDAGFGPGTRPSEVANYLVGEVLRRAGKEAT
jgi:hypothetical protein